ncbi:MAG: hypothetical protein ABSA77_08580 [Thermoguttaceae bacterium]
MRLHIIKRGVEFLGETFAGNDTVSMGESKNEEVTDLNVCGDFVERSGRMPDRRLVAPTGRSDNRTVDPHARRADTSGRQQMNNPASLATIPFQWEN